MRVAISSVFLLALTIASVYSGSKQYTLNVPRVLLPRVPSSGVKSNFTLKSEYGCFNWISTKPDVASVEPIFISTKNGFKCSREAVLTPLSTQSARLSTVITATEEATGLVLRSDVYVDTIYRIEITTRTRELLLEEEPEKFEVRAFDDEGNMFSTVRGHVFEWTLLRDDEAIHQQLDPDSILTFVKFKESSYSSDPIISSLEDQGLHGDEVLVSGINTGTAKVRVRLAEKTWETVSPDVVKLLVLENLMLIPSASVYIMPLSCIDYRVERRKHGKSEVVTMPCEQYTLEVLNTTVASLSRPLSRVTGLVIGSTEIILNDKNMLNIPHATKPSADIHVVYPHHIAFDVTPGHRWVLEVGRRYCFHVNLIDKNNHKIFITDNVLLITDVPTQFFEVSFSAKNNSYFSVRAIKSGQTSLHSSINELKHPEKPETHPLPNALSKTQLIDIFDPLKVYPTILVLLMDVMSEHQYKHQLKVLGGSGSYQWTSDNVDIVGVSTTGILTAFNIGKANVTVNDVRNPDHFDISKIYVVPPVSMLFVQSRVEVVVGDDLLLPLQVLGQILDPPQSTLPFRDCRYLNLKLSLADDAIFTVSLPQNINLATLPNGACTFIKASSLKPGHTQLTVTYESGAIHLETSVTIATYPRLCSIDPESIAIVTLGSSKGVVIEGGPSPWVLDPSRYHKNLIPEHSDKIKILSSPSASLNQHVYTLTCLKLGEQQLTFTVGNGATAKNIFPANETISIKLSCALPSSVAVHPVVREMSKCPLLQEGSQDIQFPVLNQGTLSLNVVVYDNKRRQFDNFSSLEWTWTSSDYSLLSLTSTKLTHYGNRAELLTNLPKRSGSVTITGKTNSHLSDILFTENIIFQDPFAPPVNFSLALLLQNEPILYPSTLLVYNHPSNKVTVSILHGSSYFAVDHIIKPRPPVADIIYIKESHQINILPLGEGQINIYVQDLCLPVDPVSGVVHVSNIYFIHVKVSDKVQVGNTIIAYVSLKNNDGKSFPSDQHRLMKLLPNPKTDNIDVRPATKSLLSTINEKDTIENSLFVIKGVAMGTAVLLFNATTTSGKVISSVPVEIQVFDALCLTPENITLVPTAIFQIYSSGGPSHQTTVTYSINNDTVATVDHTGLITAITPGNAVVTGQSKSNEVHSWSVYSSDQVNVKVVLLKGIKIIIPSTKLVTNEEIAVYAQGSDENETPFSFGSAVPGLSFQWTVSNMDVLSLVSVYDKAGISLQDERDFTARLRTRNPGQAVIRVIVKCPRSLCVPDEATFTDEVHLSIFARLSLLNPANGHFLLPQNGIAKIITNRDGTSHISYNLIRSSIDDTTQSVVTITPNGEVHTAGFNGHAVVMVTADEIDLQLNQSVIVHIEVRPLYSLSLMSLSSAKATLHSKQHAFPLGYSAHFIANLHDFIGRRFNFAGIDLSYRLNRFDIVHVTRDQDNDSSFIVKAAKQGNVVLKVWAKDNPNLSDYIRVRVGYAIIPFLATVHLGARVCFTTHLTEDNPGTWETGGEGILQIEKLTGVAKAVATGRAVVYHKMDSVVDTHTEISVATIQKVVFNLTSINSNIPPLFTNAQRPDELGPYLIPVEFKDEHNNTDFTLLQASPNKACLEGIVKDNTLNALDDVIYLQQVKFDCVLELQSFGNVLLTSKYVASNPLFDHVTGRSYCNLLPVLDDDGARKTISTMDHLRLTLKVKAKDFDETYDVWSELLSIPFYPAFHCDIVNVSLTTYQHTSLLTISGLNTILNSLQISCPHPITVKQQSMNGATAVYAISLTDVYSPPLYNITEMDIVITSSFTYQKVILPVSYTAVTEPVESVICSVQNQSNISTSLFDGIYNQWNLVFVIACTVITILATIVICLALKQSSTKTPTGFKAQLPPTPQPNTPAFPSTTTSASTPPNTTSQFSTPLWTVNQSAFKRTGGTANYRHQSPTRTSPQYNMFSQ